MWTDNNLNNCYDLWNYMCINGNMLGEFFYRGLETHIPSYKDFPFSKKQVEIIDYCVFFFSRVSKGLFASSKKDMLPISFLNLILISLSLCTSTSLSTHRSKRDRDR